MSLFTPPLPIDDDRVVAAIAAAEKRTSGEIRVFISRQKTTDALAAARQHFLRMGMAETASRNGVLIFVAPPSHVFAVIGDEGVHEKCGTAFWADLTAAMSAHFKAGHFTDGLVLGIERAGALLATHFPRAPGDSNELPDHVERE